jgi:dipeptidyl aminopeptidase/acylaminoacyl peptidase
MLGEDPATGLRQLCLGRIIRGRVEPTCIDSPAGVELGSTIRWAPDGKSLLVFGNTADDRAQFGIVRYRSPRPFSARADDWSTSGYVTDVTQPGRGVIDAAFSPDAKRLAIVSNLVTRGEFQVLMTTPADLGREPGKAIGVTACKVTWRPDGIELVVMQADDCVGTAAGRILGIPLEDPQNQRALRLVGDNMTFAPLKVGP